MKVMESFRLDGKVAMITGGARHLGYDMAEALAEAGCHLVITSRSQESAAESAEKLREAYGVDVLPLALDVTDFDRVVAVSKQAEDWKGRIDILINNAGGGGGDLLRPSAPPFPRARTADLHFRKWGNIVFR